MPIEMPSRCGARSTAACSDIIDAVRDSGLRLLPEESLDQQEDGGDDRVAPHAKREMLTTRLPVSDEGKKILAAQIIETLRR